VQRVSQSNPQMRGFRGRLKGILFNGDQTTAFETTFVNKPWVTEWSEFSNNTRPGEWVVGRSQQFCTNEGEADNFARFGAAQQLIPAVVSRLDGEESASESFIREKIIEQLRSRGPSDRFVQRIDRPYGSLYQVAILVPTGDPLASQVAENVSSQLASQKRAARSTFGGIVVLSLVILVLYWFLNAVTKGYFTWRLRMAVVVILLIAGMLAFVAVRLFAPHYAPAESPRAVRDSTFIQ
jgi:hypothetical protein